MDLADLYRDVIVDHNRQPAEPRPLAGATHQPTGDNPLCGDRLSLDVEVAGDVIRDLRFEGSGCAISTASASLMSEAVKGQHARRGGRALRRRAPHADRRARRDCRTPRQAGRARGRARVPGAGQVREPLLAHAERGARAAGATRSRRNEHAPRRPRAGRRQPRRARRHRAGGRRGEAAARARVGYITQALGGSYTVYVEGNLFRIAGADGDAIGKEPMQPPALPPGATDEDVNRVVWDQLRTCFDPEIPINIVDLGLVYDCKVADNADGTRDVAVKMTLTAPGCGMGEVLVADVRDKLRADPDRAQRRRRARLRPAVEPVDDVGSGAPADRHDVSDARRRRPGPSSSALAERQQRGVAADGRRVDRDGLLGGEARQVVRPAGLRPRARQPAAAERLHADDRADHVAVHVDVADARARRDALRDAVDARVDAEREAVAARVDRVDDLVEPRPAKRTTCRIGPNTSRSSRAMPSISTASGAKKCPRGEAGRQPRAVMPAGCP